MYTIKGSNVNLRSGPGTTYPSGGLLQNGDEVENIKIPEGKPGEGELYFDAEGYRWVYVEVKSGNNKGHKGYVASGFLNGY